MVNEMTLPDWALHAPGWWKESSEAHIVCVTGMYHSGRQLLVRTLSDLSDWPFTFEGKVLMRGVNLRKLHREEHCTWFEHRNTYRRYRRRLESIAAWQDALIRTAKEGKLQPRALMVASLFTSKLRKFWLDLSPHHWLIWKQVANDDILERAERRLAQGSGGFSLKSLKRYLRMVEPPKPAKCKSWDLPWCFSAEERVIILPDDPRTGLNAGRCLRPD